MNQDTLEMSNDVQSDFPFLFPLDKLKITNNWNYNLSNWSISLFYHSVGQGLAYKLGCYFLLDYSTITFFQGKHEKITTNNCFITDIAKHKVYSFLIDLFIKFSHVLK